MQKHPNDGSNDNPDEFSEFRDKKHVDVEGAENIQVGAEEANRPPAQAMQSHPDAAQPNAGTPHYGHFGDKDAAAAASSAAASDRPAGTNPGGTAAPSTTDPNQRGSTPQNLNPGVVVNQQDAPEEDSRAAFKADDPRYGGGTRNWPTNEPANPTTEGPDPNKDNLL